tara:strand:+ start:290 stop:415 length:126 start_codon:yes stop_codon:yes gene_type:complete
MIGTISDLIEQIKGVVADTIALDITLKRNDRNWFEILPVSI